MLMDVALVHEQFVPAAYVTLVITPSEGQSAHSGKVVVVVDVVVVVVVVEVVVVVGGGVLLSAVHVPDPDPLQLLSVESHVPLHLVSLTNVPVKVSSPP